MAFGKGRPSLCFSLCALTSVACIGGLDPKTVAPRDDFATTRDPPPLSAAHALEDLDQALALFRGAYAAPEGRNPVPDPDAVAAARARITERSALSPRAFAGLLRTLFWQPDGHLAFAYGGPSAIRVAAKAEAGALVSEPLVKGDATARVGTCASEHATAARAPSRLGTVPTLDGSFVLAAIGSYADESIVCELEAVPEPRLVTFRRARSANPALRRVTFEDDGALPIVHLGTLDASAFDSLTALPSLARTLRGERGFLLDLRGNRGGSVRFAEAFLQELSAVPLRRLDERHVVSIAAAEGRANTIRERLSAAGPGTAAAAYLEAELATEEAEVAALRRIHAPRTEVVTRGVTIPGLAPSPLLGPSVIVIDEGCASACEMTVAMARQLPSAIVVGRSTRGSMAVGEIATFHLRWSTITITMGTRAYTDPSGAFDESTGYLPDVWMDPEKALAFARRVILDGNAPGRRGSGIESHARTRATR